MSAQQIIGKKGNLELIFGNKNRKELIQAVNEMTTDFNYEKLLLKKVKIENDLDIICFILSTLYQNYLIKKTKIEKENGEDKRDFYFKLLYKIVEILAFSNKEAEKEMTRNINFTKLLFCLLLLGVVKNAPKAYENFIEFSKTYLGEYLPKYYVIGMIQSEITSPQLKNNLIEEINVIYNLWEKNKPSSCLLGDLLYNNFFSDKIRQIKTYPIPSHLKFSEPSKLVNIYDDGLTAEYISQENVCLTLRSDIPIPKAIGLFYFEVEIITIGDTIGIGIVSKDFGLLNKIPGWESDSVGYHSDDGELFLGNALGKKYGPIFGNGDYIGCCINTIEKYFFFTKNGEKLKDISYANNAGEINDMVDYYPAIGMRKISQKIKVNFGKSKFLFNFEDYRNQVIDSYFKEIIDVNVEKSINKSQDTLYLSIKGTENLIMDYLLYNGYSDTYKEISKVFIGNKSKYMCDFKVDIRKQIKCLLSEYKFDEVKDILIKNFNLVNNALIFLEFFRKLFHFSFELLLGKIDPQTFVKRIKDGIIFDSSLKEIYDKNYRRQVIKLMSVVLIKSQNVNQKLKNLLIEYFTPDEMFSTINKELLNDNYSLYDNEIEKVVKHFIFVIIESIKEVQKASHEDKSCVGIEKLLFLLSNKNFMEIINQKLLQKNIRCSEIQVANSIREYFEQLNLNK